MIRVHEFNTRWWGKPVGIVENPDFFGLSEDSIREHLSPFEWVEFKTGIESETPLEVIRRAGFFQVDTQLPFSLNLLNVENTPSTDRLETVFADEDPISVTGDQLACFMHERFRFIPECSSSRINERYALWTNDLATQFPRTCLRIEMNGVVQGWFLAQPGNNHRLHLTLAMLSSSATISGMLLYQKACLEFANRGHRLGEASFSVSNTAVHNMYANLGARFLHAIGQWLWVSEVEKGAANA